MATTRERLFEDPSLQEWQRLVRRLERTVVADPELESTLDESNTITTGIETLELDNVASALLPGYFETVEALRSTKPELEELWADFQAANLELQSSTVVGGALHGIMEDALDALREPILFCDVYPTVRIDAEIRLPFDLPPVVFDPKCERIHLSIPDAHLSVIYPFIRVAECILKIIEVVQAIPDSIGPPPDVTLLIKKLAELGDCINLLLGFTGFGAIFQFCRFIKDLVRFMIDVLNCIIELLTIIVDSKAESGALNASVDIRLVDMGACLDTQNGALQEEARQRFDTLRGIIILLNLIIVALQKVGPPFSSLEPLPEDGFQTEDAAFNLIVVRDLIDALEVIESVLDGFCPDLT